MILGIKEMDGVRLFRSQVISEVSLVSIIFAACFCVSFRSSRRFLI